MVWYIVSPIKHRSFSLFMMCLLCTSLIFFFNDTATTEIYTLSLHDALPISGTTTQSCRHQRQASRLFDKNRAKPRKCPCWTARDRKSTRLNSSHQIISYAVFCLKKKKDNSI